MKTSTNLIVHYTLFVILFFLLAIIILFGTSTASAATLRLENVTRVKGQEATTIYGYGIISGLNGSGDDPRSYGHTARAIMRKLELSGLPRGNQPGRGGRPVSVEEQLGSSRNNALVEVMVTIPSTGGREGDTLDCIVSSVGNAKSLENGMLTATTLYGVLPQAPETKEPRGLAWGKITLENPNAQLVGKVKRGCRLTGEFINPYVHQGNVTFVLLEEYANFRMATSVADAINNYAQSEAGMGKIAKAMNQNYVVVKMPTEYFSDPATFVTELQQNIEINMVRALPPRVVINERAGIITIDEGVEVKPCVVTHRDIVAEIRPPVPEGEIERNPNQFIDVDTETKYAQFQGQPVVNQKLKALQASLDAVRIPPEEMIEIIKNLVRQGAIIGDVVYMD